MCVIMLCKSRKPSLGEISAAITSNPHGVGVAWQENGGVRWTKRLAMTAKETVELIAPLNTPFLIHFRLASIGKPSDRLCHPFPVSNSPSFDPDGTADEVLCHNGHWHDWRQAAARFNVELPAGDLSDSWVITALYSRHRASFLRSLAELAGGKYAVLGRTGFHLYGSWVDVRGVLCSNTYWTSHLTH